MCKHCENLVEDVEHRELLHRFMTLTAEKISKRLGQLFSADDIGVEFTIRRSRLLPPAHAHLLKDILSDLNERGI